MTYGVDQCRVCGVRIKPHAESDMNDWLRAQKKPPIPEREWRRRGFLAAPTRQQLALPASGCCQACGEKLMLNQSHPGRRLALLLSCAGAAIAIIWTVLTFAPFVGANRGLNHEIPAYQPPPK